MVLCVSRLQILLKPFNICKLSQLEKCHFPFCDKLMDDFWENSQKNELADMPFLNPFPILGGF